MTRFFSLLLILIFLGVNLLVSTSSLADCTTNPNGAGCSATVNNGLNQTNGTIILREPLLPGKNIIDVSASQGTLGIVSQYIKMVYQYMLAAGSLIGIISLMFAGVQMMVSAGDSKAMGEAKKIITTTFQALAILYLSGLILYVINPTFFTFGGGSS